MQMYFQVRSVLSSISSEAVTLTPVTWSRESATETEEFDGEMVPVLEVCGPLDEGADPTVELGRKMTELRFDEVTGDEVFLALRPGDYVTLTVEYSRPD